MQTVITSKGQVVIPAKLRKKYGITPGMRFEVLDDGEQIILRPITPEFVHSLRGYLKGAGALKILEAERESERDR
ncbi:MAG: AbrB/MazE/SpoVT family DNA-binding domain-containing protein [Chloroflexota bacterium]